MTIVPQAADNPPPDTTTRDAAINAVAVASAAFQTERGRFAYMLNLARSKGLTTTELMDAAGLSYDQLRELLEAYE